MTSDTVRTQAQKLAADIYSKVKCGQPEGPEITDAIAAFAQRHAERVEKRARLEGRIEQADCDYCSSVAHGLKTPFYICDHQHSLRWALVLLERGEKEVG